MEVTVSRGGGGLCKGGDFARGGGGYHHSNNPCQCWLRTPLHHRRQCVCKIDLGVKEYWRQVLECSYGACRNIVYVTFCLQPATVLELRKIFRGKRGVCVMSSWAGARCTIPGRVFKDVPFPTKVTYGLSLLCCLWSSGNEVSVAGFDPTTPGMQA